MPKVPGPELPYVEASERLDRSNGKVQGLFTHVTWAGSRMIRFAWPAGKTKRVATQQMVWNGGRFARRSDSTLAYRSLPGDKSRKISCG